MTDELFDLSVVKRIMEFERSFQRSLWDRLYMHGTGVQGSVMDRQMGC